jgi:hypothetical protein
MSIRKAISGVAEPPVKQLMNLGIVGLISLCLHMPDASEEIKSIKYEALWILTNLAYGDDDDVQQMLDVKYEIPEMLMQLLKRNELIFQEQVLWLVANITGDSKQMSQTVLQRMRIYEFLSDIINMKSIPKNIMSIVVWLSSNLTKNSTLSPEDVIFKYCEFN